MFPSFVQGFVHSVACRSLVVPFSGSAPALTIFALFWCSLFLVACFAAGFPAPQRWDARTATLRIHSVLSNNALLEVIAQLQLQNQALMSLLATHPGMASDCLNTEPKPIDKVDPATENAAWNVVKNKKEHVKDPLSESLAKRGGGGDSRVALGKGAFFPHDKEHFWFGWRSNSKSRLPRASQQCGSDIWFNWAPHLSRTKLSGRHDTCCGRFPQTGTVIQMRGRR